MSPKLLWLRVLLAATIWAGLVAAAGLMGLL